MNTKKIKIPLYFGCLIVHKIDSFEEINNLYKDINVPLNTYSAIVFNDKKDNIVLAIEEVNYAIIAHEIVHIVNSIFKRAGIKLDLDNDEPQAYLTGYLMKEINKFLSAI
jgi:hypothetical protein